jgi:hypothetical protein
MFMKGLVWTVLACMVAGCAFEDARVAHAAQQRLVGWSEPELEECLGAPDHQSTFGDMDILTYFGNSTSSTVFRGGTVLSPCPRRRLPLTAEKTAAAQVEPR